jgi:hypothetical protein
MFMWHCFLLLYVCTENGERKKEIGEIEMPNHFHADLAALGGAHPLHKAREWHHPSTPHWYSYYY